MGLLLKLSLSFNQLYIKIDLRNLQESNWEEVTVEQHFMCINLELFGGAMVIVVGIGHDDTSSNPGLVAFHIALIPLGKVWIQLFSLQLWVNSRAD